jgi:hypothetical protein
MAQVETRIAHRDLTAEEAAFFQQHGWIHLEQVVAEAEAAVVLAELQRVVGENHETQRHPMGDGHNKWVRQYAPVGIENTTGRVEDPFFYELSHSPEFGRLCTKLYGRPTRFWTDTTFVKMRDGDGHDEPTPWHTDIADPENCPFSMHGQMQTWLALTPLTPEHGTMRFVAPDDQNDEVRAIVQEHSVDDSYPLLEELGVLSPPLTMRAGDMTVHASRTLHSAPRNVAGTPRWAYLVSAFPAHAVYSGMAWWPMEGVEGMEIGKQFPDHRFPVLG